jgi:hypothetical protein
MDERDFGPVARELWFPGAPDVVARRRFMALNGALVLRQRGGKVQATANITDGGRLVSVGCTLDSLDSAPGLAAVVDVVTRAKDTGEWRVETLRHAFRRGSVAVRSLRRDRKVPLRLDDLDVAVARWHPMNPERLGDLLDQVTIVDGAMVFAADSASLAVDWTLGAFWVMTDTGSVLAPLEPHRMTAAVSALSVRAGLARAGLLSSGYEFDEALRNLVQASDETLAGACDKLSRLVLPECDRWLGPAATGVDPSDGAVAPARLVAAGRCRIAAAGRRGRTSGGADGLERIAGRPEVLGPERRWRLGAHGELGPVAELTLLPCGRDVAIGWLAVVADGRYRLRHIAVDQTTAAQLASALTAYGAPAGRGAPELREELGRLVALAHSDLMTAFRGRYEDLIASLSRRAAPRNVVDQHHMLMAALR